MDTAYIGFANTFHDSAIAIVNGEGQVVFAEATERFMQNKRAMNIAPDAFLRTTELIEQYCPHAAIVAAFTWSDAYHQAIADRHSRHSANRKSLEQHRDRLPEFISRNLALRDFMFASQVKATQFPGTGLAYELSQLADGAGRLRATNSYSHHLTHAAFACFSSPFEDAVCAVIDGFGEGRAFACYSYKEGRLSELEVLSAQAKGSLGGFYMEICDACGFGQLKGEEWKVMGLASYGEMDEEIYGVIKEMIRVDGTGFETPSDYSLVLLRQRLNKLRRKADEPAIAARNIAYAGQKVFTEVLLKFLENLHATGISDNLVLTGGCALNSSANGRILENLPFKNLHVPCAPADDGNAVGAALLAYQQDNPAHRFTRKHLTPYLGSTMSAETLANVEKFGGICTLTKHETDAPEKAAELLAEGKIVGWIQGRAEFGPRALGNRSILADPRSPKIKEILNSRVKFREEFRPFAPSILEEFGPQYFENFQSSPYMERTLRFKQDKIVLVPGVVHHDGTGRLQTVRREWNEEYYRLLLRFYELTNIPLVVNTSFNVMGKPIVHSVEDVLAVFYTSGLDAVFINGTMISK